MEPHSAESGGDVERTELIREETGETTSRVRGRRFSGLAILVVAAAAIGLAGCGAGTADSPHVASVGHTGGSSSRSDSGRRSSTTTAPTAGNPTQLMDEWAACMRVHGDPNQTDPIIDQYGVINIIMPTGSEALSSEVHGSTGPCSQYEVEAENALRAAHPVAPPPDQAQMVQYTDCMRTHGVPNYPDPGADGKTDFNGTGVDPSSPFFENANNVCGKQIDAPAWWIAGTGPPGDVTVTSQGLTQNGGPPPSPVQEGNNGSGPTRVPVRGG
jgi:hypothetical protein